jgi:Mrp family chromosome partitioning ATPase
MNSDFSQVPTLLKRRLGQSSILPNGLDAFANDTRLTESRLQPRTSHSDRQPSADGLSESFASLDLAPLFDRAVPASPCQRAAASSVNALRSPTAMAVEARLPRQPNKAPAAVRTSQSSVFLPLSTNKETEWNPFQTDLHRILEQMRALQDSKQIVGFASACSGEGVSTLCSALAVLSATMQKALCQAAGVNNHAGVHGQPERYTLLLIDAQWHHPTLHALFRVPQTPGLAGLLAGARRTPVVSRISPHLHLLPCGHFAHNYLTQTEWAQFAAFLHQAATYYSHIFIDLPALTRYPAAIDLARLCQGVTLVVEAHKTSRQAIMASQNLLGKNGIPVLGAILNKRQRSLPDWLEDKF